MTIVLEAPQKMFWSSPCNEYIWRACHPCCVLAGAVSVPQMIEMCGHTHSMWTVCFPFEKKKNIWVSLTYYRKCNRWQCKNCITMTRAKEY